MSHLKCYVAMVNATGEAEPVGVFLTRERAEAFLLPDRSAGFDVWVEDFKIRDLVDAGWEKIECGEHRSRPAPEYFCPPCPECASSDESA